MAYTGNNSTGYSYGTYDATTGMFKLTDISSDTTPGTSYVLVGPMGYSGSVTFSYQSVNTITNIAQTFDGSQNRVFYYDSSAIPTFPDGIAFDLNGTLSNWTLINGWQTSNTTQSGSQTINFLTGDYVGILMTGNGTQDGSVLFSGFLQPDGSQPLSSGGGSSGSGGSGGICFHKNSKVLMENGKYKKISEIQRGDIVIQDITTKETAVVSRNYAGGFTAKCVKIQKNTLGNREAIICTENHPIWTQDNQRRLLACNLPNVEKIEMKDIFYNLQFDEEGTYIVNGIKVDSLSPYHKQKRLPYDLFIDKTKFIPDRRVLTENQADRNKPKLLL